jgi:hypothetical protein
MTAEARVALAAASDPDARMPWSVSASAEADYRDHQVQNAGDSLPVLVYAGSLSNTAGGTDDVLTVLNPHTLPTLRMHRVGGTLGGELGLTRDIGLHLTGSGWASRAGGGKRGMDWQAEAGVSYRLHDNEHILLGATWSSISPWAEAENTVLPVLEWHATYSERFRIVLGFPRVGIDWQPWDGTRLRVRYAFMGDGDVTIDQHITGPLSIRGRGWHRGRAYTNGTNIIARSVIGDFWFFDPIDDDYRAGFDNHLYILESGVSITAVIDAPEWGLQAEIGPIYRFQEAWYVGPDAQAAERHAALEGGFGATAQVNWTF